MTRDKMMGMLADITTELQGADHAGHYVLNLKSFKKGPEIQMSRSIETMVAGTHANISRMLK